MPDECEDSVNDGFTESFQQSFVSGANSSVRKSLTVREQRPSLQGGPQPYNTQFIDALTQGHGNVLRNSERTEFAAMTHDSEPEIWRQIQLDIQHVVKSVH